MIFYDWSKRVHKAKRQARLVRTHFLIHPQG